MATITWIGGTSTDSGTAANWSPASIPTVGDVALFNNSSLVDCAWTLTSSGSLTLDEIIIEDSFQYQVILNASPVIKGMYLGGILNAGSAGAITFKHGSAPNYFGSYKTYNERFVLLGNNASYVGNVIFSFQGLTTPVTKFDDGSHPILRLNTGKFAPDYVVPTGTSGKASFAGLSALTGSSFEPEGAFVDNDRLKVFDFTIFDATSVDTVNFGLATVEFTASSSGVVLPTHNATGYSSTFQAYYRKIVLKADTHGDKILLADNTFISVEEFEIDDGCMLVGPKNLDSQGSDIRSIVSPKIRGSWSYSQISPGIYRSPRHASGPIDLINGNVHITGKLNVDGLIDPTGLELDPVSSNPGGVAANTLWLNSADSNKLYHGSTEVGTGTGAQGPAGPQGPAGNDGADGADGATGATGATGPAGSTGPAGPQGQTGATGAAGSNGSDGSDGSDGNDGAQGPQGPQGPAGATGPAGSQGPQGPAGATGAAGADGADGADGSNGAQGPAGPAGSTGPTGNTGPAGSTGPAGATGAAGADGLDGYESANQQTNLSTGWWTFALVKGRNLNKAQRAMGQFYVADTSSGRHRACRIEVGHHYGRDGGNQINLFSISGYGYGVPFTKFRLVEGNTYDGAALQIYISNSTNRINAHMLFNLQTGDGWTLLNQWLPNADIGAHDAYLGYTAGGYNNWAVSMVAIEELNLEDLVRAVGGGGMATTGSFVVQKDFKASGGVIQTDNANSLGFFGAQTTQLPRPPQYPTAPQLTGNLTNDVQTLSMAYDELVDILRAYGLVQ